jgi:hypothetical protein
MNAVHAAHEPAEEPTAIALERLVARFDPTVFDVGRPRVPIRIQTGGALYTEERTAAAENDVVVDDATARLTSARGSADAILTADPATWVEIAADSVRHAARPGRVLRGGSEYLPRRAARSGRAVDAPPEPGSGRAICVGA